MKKRNEVKEIADEVDLIDDMLTSLVELLVEKGVITQEEWEQKVRIRIESKPSKSIRNL